MQYKIIEKLTAISLREGQYQTLFYFVNNYRDHFIEVSFRIYISYSIDDEYDDEYDRFKWEEI